MASPKFPAHQPQRPLGLACSPCPRPILGRHPADPQLPSNGWHGPSPPAATIPTPRLWAIQRLSQEVTIRQSYPSLEVLFQLACKHGDLPNPQESSECLIRPH